MDKKTANMKKRKKGKSRKNTARRRKKKGFTWKHALTLGVLLGLVVCGVLAFYVTVGNSRFLGGTKINGYNVSGKVPAAVVEMLAKKYDEKTISIREGDRVVYEEELKELGYQVDRQELKKLVDALMEEQTENVLGQLMSAKEHEIEIPFLIDDGVIGEAITEKNLEGERIESQDAVLVLKDGTYSIQEEVYGNKVKEEVLQKLVRGEIEEHLYQLENLTIELTDDLYDAPAVTAEDAELNLQMTYYNKYCKAKVTHTFGSEKVVLDWETIQEWLVKDADTMKLDEDLVSAYVDSLKSRYDTIYGKRTIQTSHGTQVTLESNDYGYRIDRAKEIAQLLEDICANTETQRDPIYSYEGYHRNGRDDVLGCYIEIDLTNQHIWLYKDYKLVVESDIVTGDPSYQETHTGAFPIAYKKSPSVLKGATWNTEVQYWMPFYDGQGLHDATWRKTFGGEIYKTNGSHGCVNLPYSVAEKIYNSIEAGYPLFLYK